MTDFFKDPERWLNPYAHLGRGQRRRQYRHGRFHLGMDRLPRPDLARAPRHVLQVFTLYVLPLAEKEGWAVARTLPRQKDWWYVALALTVAQVAAETHVESCHVCSKSPEDWEFLMDYPVRTPRGEAFDITGNVKPAEEEA
jgi:hypothetical protein